MWANVLGIPLFVVIFLATDHYLTEWDLIGDRASVDAIGVCLGLLGYFFARGIDTYLNQKRDNPDPLYSEKPLPEVFGQIKEVLAESSFGPFFWGLKTVDQEASRIVATLNFTEQLGTPVTPMQAQRLVMLQVLVDSIPEEEQKPLFAALPDHGKGITSIKLQWLIDSPLNRNTVNRIQEECTKAIKVSLGLATSDKPKETSPFAPPDWVWILLILACCFAGTRMDQYTIFKQQRADQLKAAEEDRATRAAAQEEAQRKALEAQAARDSYNKQMQARFQQGRIDQQRKADELLQQQRQNQFQPYTPQQTQTNPFTQPLGSPSGSLFSSPFKVPSSETSAPSNTAPWRSGQ